MAQLTALDFSSLRVEKIAPQTAPDGSQWRKTKLHLPRPPPIEASAHEASTSRAEGHTEDCGASSSSEHAATTSGSGTDVKYW